jgi:2-polyprenyl-3-methyl-5-hydroxy-6-metoxy-1,4-benzoquinol methylase
LEHDLKLDSEFYEGEYVDSKYDDLEGVKERFEQIMDLPPEDSDNEGRVRRIVQHVEQVGLLERSKNPSVLDVGSGLGVFPARLREEKWPVTALDPDPRAVRHMREHVGVRTVQADFEDAQDLGTFDLVTFNKVLEHVPDPRGMLEKATQHLSEHGCVYVEVPDGERARRTGKEREEFVIEHLRAFTPASLAILVDRAGLELERLERIQDPSSKFTIFAFCRPRDPGPRRPDA